MKDIHIEINEVLLEFRNRFWQEAQQIVHSNTSNLTGYEIAQVAIQRVARQFLVSPPENAQGDSHD